MAAIKLNNGCTLEISPIIKKPEIFFECNIRESIFGELPDLTLTLKTSKAPCNINDKITGSLNNGKGYKIIFNGFVYSISYVNDKYVIKIVCIDPKFVNEEYSTKFKSMNKAIEYLYPDPDKIIWNNSKSELLNDIYIYQKKITNYNMIKKCLISYKENTIYGFALGDLRLNDLNNWKSNDKLVPRVNIKQVTASELTDPKLYNKDTEIIDYSDKKDPNHVIVKYYDKYIPVNNEYKFLIKNFLYNSRFIITKNIVNYTLRELLPHNITDFIGIEDNKNKVKECFISSRIINLKSLDSSDSDLQVDYTIQSINPFGIDVIPSDKKPETLLNITSPPSKGEVYSSEDLGIIS